MNNLVSIIIPSYNAYKYIGEALDSALNQSYENIEIIIIDDGSTDNTDKILKSYLANKCIKYIKIKHSGLASVARNKGIEASTGSYLAFLDADDTWAPNKLEEQMRLFEDDVALVYSDGELIDQGSQKQAKKYSELTKFYRGHVFQKLILKNFIATSSVVVKKSTLDELGTFSSDPKLRVGEDYDLWLRIAQKYKINYSRKNLFQYRIDPLSLTGDKKRAYQGLSYLYKRWLKKKISKKEKMLFLISLIKNYLKIIYKTF